MFLLSGILSTLILFTTLHIPTSIVHTIQYEFIERTCFFFSQRISQKKKKCNRNEKNIVKRIEFTYTDLISKLVYFTYLYSISLNLLSKQKCLIELKINCLDLIWRINTFVQVRVWIVELNPFYCITLTKVRLLEFPMLKGSRENCVGNKFSSLDFSLIFIIKPCNKFEWTFVT